MMQLKKVFIFLFAASLLASCVADVQSKIVEVSGRANESLQQIQLNASKEKVPLEEEFKDSDEFVLQFLASDGSIKFKKNFSWVKKTLVSDCVADNPSECPGPEVYMAFRILYMGDANIRTVRLFHRDSLVASVDVKEKDSRCKNLACNIGALFFRLKDFVLH